MFINGVELIFDASDADTLNNYLTATGVCAEKANKMEDPGKDQAKVVESYRYMCRAVRTVFDDIFGEGTGRKVCGTGDSIRNHREAYMNLTQEYNRQLAEEKKANDEFNKSVKGK